MAKVMAYCMKEKAKREMVNPKVVTMKNKRNYPLTARSGTNALFFRKCVNAP